MGVGKGAEKSSWADRSMAMAEEKGWWWVVEHADNARSEKGQDNLLGWFLDLWFVCPLGVQDVDPYNIVVAREALCM